jgi:hypothetical protein
LPRRWKSNTNGDGNSYDTTTGKSDTDSDGHSKWNGDTASIGYADSDGNHPTNADAKAPTYALSTAHAVTAKRVTERKVTGTREATRESLAVCSCPGIDRAKRLRVVKEQSELVTGFISCCGVALQEMLGGR